VRRAPVLRILCRIHDSVSIAKVERVAGGLEYQAEWPLPPDLGRPIAGTVYRKGASAEELRASRREGLLAQKVRTGRRVPAPDDRVRVLLDQIDFDEETLDGRLPAWCSGCRGIWWLDLDWIRRSVGRETVVRADGVLVSD